MKVLHYRIVYSFMGQWKLKQENETHNLQERRGWSQGFKPRPNLTTNEVKTKYTPLWIKTNPI